MSRRKHRSAFDQVSEFNRGRIMAHRDRGSSFRKIGSHVGRNQTIADMGPLDAGGYNGPTWSIASTSVHTLREGRQIVRIAVTDRSITSRTVAQHIESITHHSVSARSIRRRVVCPQDVHCLVYP
ncbi:HTH_38 domain-containing protein [Trichonephila clavipes]|nr:HTH_38 domain-containing protein [Trichonephila clavipes]